MSANSLILTLHDSSVGSVCQPSALVSLSSLDLNRFGKQSLRYDRGKTSAITPPSLVLTETPYIIDAHILDETTRTHACTYSLQIPQSLLHMQHIHTHEIPLPLPNLLPLFLSFFRQPASISTSPVSVMMLSSLMLLEVSFFPLPSPLLLSTCSAALSTRHQGSRTPSTHR